MNLAWLWLIIPVGYITGMAINAPILGWCLRKERYDDIPATLGTIFWPIALVGEVAYIIFGPFARLVYKFIRGAYELGKGQSDLQVGARTKKMFGRIGR
jgi:hypothetical protein